MKITFDPIKNTTNKEKPGFSLDMFELLDMSAAFLKRDARHDYSEMRFRVFAPIYGRLCTGIFTLRGQEIRAISLRKSNARERKKYEKETAGH